MESGIENRQAEPWKTEPRQAELRQAETRPAEPQEPAMTLYYGESCREILLEQIAVILGRPELVRVPGAPEEIAGLLEWKGRLVPVRYPEGTRGQASFQCVVLVKKEDEGLYGILADRLTGGEPIDPFYGE